MYDWPFVINLLGSHNGNSMNLMEKWMEDHVPHVCNRNHLNHLVIQEVKGEVHDII